MRGAAQEATLLRARLNKAELDRQALQGRLEAEALARAQARRPGPPSLPRSLAPLSPLAAARSPGGRPASPYPHTPMNMERERRQTGLSQPTYPDVSVCTQTQAAHMIDARIGSKR